MSTVLAKMAVQIAGNTAEFNKAMKDTSNNLKNFTSNIQSMAASVGIAFGVREVASFVLEVSKLAGEAKGVKDAFDRLPNSVRLMNDLKEATGGTVSELELMKRAVQASNFDISLGSLPKLLQFATLRAQQTGQSVDYLVDSIVTGIGRKSKLILDNLGISAEQLKQEFNGASLEAQSVGEVADAVGRIAEKALGNMAGFSENASTKLQRLAASWENLKVAIGSASNETGVLGGATDTLTNILDYFSNGNVSGFEKYLTSVIALTPGGTMVLKAQADSIKALTDAQKKLDEQRAKSPEQLEAEAIERRNRVLAEMEARIPTINKLKETLKELSNQFESTNIAETGRLKAIGDEIIKTEELIKKIEELRKAQERVFKSSVNQSIKNPVANLSGNLVEAKVPQSDKLPGSFSSPFTIIPQEVLDANAKAIEAYQRQLEESQILRNQFASGLTNFITDMSESIAQVSRGTISFGDAILRGLAGFMKTFGQQLIALGTAKLGLDKLFVTGFGAPFAIAAGIALVAAAGFVAQNAAAGIRSLSGGGSVSSARVSSGGVQTAGGAINVNVTGKIEADGNKMLVIIQNAQHSNLVRKGG